MKRIFKSFFILIIVVFVTGCHKSETSSIYQELKSVNKMVFAKMAITKTALNEDFGTWYKAEWGKRIAAFSYDTYMRAYIDLSSLQMEDLTFDENTHTVHVLLPPIQTELTGRDIEMKEVYSNYTGGRDSLEVKEITKLKEDANTDLKNEIEENPMYKKHLIEAAKFKARKYFETIFEENGYVASIDFKTE